MFKIKRDSSIPLHIQLVNELRHAILSGQLNPHDRLPGEYELVSQLGISRSTVQRAWQSAIEEGLIYRIAAKGTYVADLEETNSRVKVVGCIVPEFRYTYDGNLLNGAEKTLRAQGYRLLFAQSERQIQLENALIKSMCKEGVSGILLWPNAGHYEDRFAASGDCAVPIVLLDRPIPGTALPCVTSRSYNGGLSAMAHLLDLGHTRIEFAAWPPLEELWPIHERHNAYVDAMQNAGLEPRPVITLGGQAEADSYKRYSEEGNEDVARLVEHLHRPDRPTAIFAMNDLVAMLVMRAAHQAELMVPRDLSIVGFDNLELAEHVIPSLTTVAQNTTLIGAEAARRLLALIDGAPPQDMFTMLPTNLIIRKSTAAPP
jgi:DNA-binding LacI/PurR family transcriptional regulator